jgi:Fic family protein
MVRYIWDDPSWPAFRWDATAATSALTRAARLQGEVIGAVRHLSDEGRRRLEIDALTADAVETSRIEGEIVDPASVRRSIARRLQKTDSRSGRVHDAEAIAALTVDATVHAPRLSGSRLRRWHQLLFAGDGAFRTDEIAVESGPAGAARIHFEGPPPGRLEAEVDAFLAWAGGPDVPDPFIAAAIAHLWFVTIHPFPDGNGRISRAIADNVLARSFPEPTRYISMTRYISQHREDYYGVLERTQRHSLDVTAWLLWFLEAYAEAAEATLRIIEETTSALGVWARIAPLGLNERQAAMIGRLLDDFHGKLTTPKYAALSKVSEDTALRDLADLAQKGVLTREGSGKKTTWALAVPPGDV